MANERSQESSGMIPQFQHEIAIGDGGIHSVGDVLRCEVQSSLDPIDSNRISRSWRSAPPRYLSACDPQAIHQVFESDTRVLITRNYEPPLALKEVDDLVIIDSNLILFAQKFLL